MNIKELELLGFPKIRPTNISNKYINEDNKIYNTALAEVKEFLNGVVVDEEKVYKFLNQYKPLKSGRTLREDLDEVFQPKLVQLIFKDLSKKICDLFKEWT